MKTTSDFIAKRFRSIDAGLSLDTEALARYNDVIDLSIGDTDFITDDAIIDAAFHDAKAGYTHYGQSHGRPGADSCGVRGLAGGFPPALNAGSCSDHRLELPWHGAGHDGHSGPRR